MGRGTNPDDEVFQYYSFKFAFEEIACTFAVLETKIYRLGGIIRLVYVDLASSLEHADSQFPKKNVFGPKINMLSGTGW